MGDILRDTPADGICRLTLNRPDALNSLTFSMYEELLDHLEAVRYDHDVRVVILTGAGRGFCSGGDQDDITQFPLALCQGGLDALDSLDEYAKKYGVPRFDQRRSWLRSAPITRVC